MTIIELAHYLERASKLSRCELCYGIGISRNWSRTSQDGEGIR